MQTEQPDSERDNDKVSRARHAASASIRDKAAESSSDHFGRHAAPSSDFRETESTNQQSTQADAAQYEPENYGSGTEKSHRGAKQQANRSKHKALKIVIAIIVILIAAAAIAVFAYAHELDNRLGFEDASNTEGVKSALTPAQDNEPFYVLLLGSDSRKYSDSSTKKGVSSGSNNSDVMMLVRVDAANKKVTLVSIPRDTRWYDTKRKKVRKINTAYNDGPAHAIKAVEQLTGVKISHYAQINMDGFESLVDSVGGIKVNVPQKIGYKDALTKEYIELQPGEQVLNGQQAQIFARARHEYKDQEATRQSNNRQIVEALITSIRNQPITKLPEVGLNIANCLDTDFDSATILALAEQFLSGDITIYSGTGPTEGGIYQDDQLWYCYTNTKGWKKLMETVDQGNDPSKLKYKTPQESIDQANNVIDDDTVHDPSTATDLSGTTAS
ncbi:MAG: LCP family protein [Eggerthellaceae bacterium]